MRRDKSVCVQFSSVNMASQEEHNKLESISNVNKDQERYYLNVYKKYESILNDKSEKFENKVQSLIEVWKSISELNFSQFDIKYIIQIIDWAKLHALNVVLTGEWRSTKEHFRDSLLECIEKAQRSLASVNDAFSTRCQKLADVVKKPWEDPVLYNLIQERDAEIGSKEIEFFCVETAYLVSVRLKKLCENHCEDLALNLVTNFLKCKRQAVIQNFNLNATETQLWFIFDIYIALLYKFQDKSKILEQFEELQLDEGVQLIKRFAKKRVKISKIWRNCHKIAIFGSRYFLSKILMKYTSSLKGSLTDLLKTYLVLSSTESLLQEFVVSVRNLTNLADAEGLCVMCNVIHRGAAEKLRHFAIEMYIRALTTDMNELERLKHVNDEEKVKMTTSRLAHTFTDLADLLNDHVKVARECVLTAFSLEPTKDRLQRIEELARRSGFEVLDTGQEWKCRLHPPVLPSDELAWVCPECGEWMCKPELAAPLHMNTPLQEALQESVLGISESLCDDLVVCVSNPRYQILSWLLSWNDLYRLCILYLNDPQKTKNFVTELKFVDVDYSMFQHIKREPVDEYTGIEKGYEQYLDLNFVSDEENSSASEDSTSLSESHERSLCLGSDGTGEPSLLLAQSMKSDPNTLKSLRMFRPNLKRKKDDEPHSSTKKVPYIPENDWHREDGYQFSSVSPSNLAARVSFTPPEFSETNGNSYRDGQQYRGSHSMINYSSNSRATKPNQENIAEQSLNSVFDSTNLSSVTSTSYVSNIIKSSLTFGVPKVTANNSTKQTASTSSSLLSLPSNLTKKHNNPSASFFSSNTVSSLKHTSSKKLPKPQTITKPSSIKSSTQVSDLDAILKEVVQDMDTEAELTNNSEPKNEAATLPLLGGQVANSQEQPIQVLQPTQTKSPPEMSSPNGISDECKMKQQNISESSSEAETTAVNGTPDLSPIMSETDTMENGELPVKLRNLTIRIVKLDPEKCQEYLQPNQIIPENSETTSDTSQVHTKEVIIPLERLDQSILVAKLITKTPKIIIVKSNLSMLQAALASPPQSVPKIEECNKLAVSLKGKKTLFIPLTEIPLATRMAAMENSALPISLTSHSPPAEITTHLQQVQKMVDTSTDCLVPCQDQACPMEIQREEVQEKTFDEPLQITRRPEGSDSLQNDIPPQEVYKKPVPVPCRLDKIIIVPQEKVKELLALASFNKVACQTTIKPSELHELCSAQTETETVPIHSNQSHSSQSQTETTTTCDKENRLVDSDEKTEDVVFLTDDSSLSNNDLLFSEAVIKCEDNACFDIQTVTEIEATGETNTTSTVCGNNSSGSKDHLDVNIYGDFSTINKNVNIMDCDSNNITDVSSNNVSKGLQYCDNDEVLRKIDEWLDGNDSHTIKEEDVSQDMNYKCGSISSNDLNASESCHPALQQEAITLADSVAELNEAVEDDSLIVPNPIQSNQVLTESTQPLFLEQDFCDDTNNVSDERFDVTSKPGPSTEQSIEEQVSSFFEETELVNVKHTADKNKNFSDDVTSQSILKKPKLPNSKENVRSPFQIATDKLKLFSDHYGDESRSELDKENIKETSFQLNYSQLDDAAMGKFDFEYYKSKFFQDFPYDKPGIKKYYNSRKRKHDDVPCFKLDQEKDVHKYRSRRPPAAQNPLPESGSRPVKIFVTEASKNDEERNRNADGEIYKKASPLADYNVDNLTEIKSKRKRIFDLMDLAVKNYSTNDEPLNLRIPGLHDYSEMLPRNVDHVVNVVQHSLSRSTNVPGQNTQTSTQVTPHIQRIGQPKLVTDRKSERYDSNSDLPSSSSATGSANSTPPTSTLINVLTANKAAVKAVQPKTTPYVNLLSQQVIRPTTTTDRPTTTVIKVEPDEQPDTQATKTVNTNLRIVTTTTQAGVAATASSPAQGSTILQFICKSSSLPKFQQAFGKTVYQGNNDATPETASVSADDSGTPTPTTTAAPDVKKITAKALPVNVQPISGNVIFRGQVPVGQTVSLIPPGSNTRQLFRITGSTHEQISLVKETVIQNKMSALLAAALQGKPKITEQNGELVEEYSATRITLCRPGAVPTNAARIIKPVQLQIPANAVRAPQPNVSSTTLEQLREFDMVYKQVKERSSNPAQPESTSQSNSQEAPQQQRISFTYVNQVQKYTQLAPVVVVSSYSPQQNSSQTLSQATATQNMVSVTQANAVMLPKITVKASKGKTIRSAVAKTSPTPVPPIAKPQQKPQEDEHTTQRIFDILAEYAEQLRNSPDLNNKPAPRRRSNPPTNPNSNNSSSSSSKKKKKKCNNSSSSLNLVETDNEDLTMGSEDSSGGNPVQLSMTDEEQSQSASVTPPESNLEPATSNSLISARPLLVADSSTQPRNVIIADSSMGDTMKIPNTALIMPGNYIMPVSVVKGGQQIAVVSGGSKILTTVPTRSGQNMLLFQSFTNQNKKGAISAVKYSTLQPFSSLSTPTVQAPVILPSNSVTAVALAQPITLKKIDDREKTNSTELLLTIAPSRETATVEKSPEVPLPDSSTNMSGESAQCEANTKSNVSPSSTADSYDSTQKTNSVATSVIAAVVKKEEELNIAQNISDTTICKENDSSKPVQHRIGSVLVNASSSNGPMLSHTNAKYRKANEEAETTTAAPPKEFTHGKVPQGSTTKVFKNNAVYYAIRTKKNINKKIDPEVQKQAAIERELRLQKSLSEECEDLGVDEPSASDLFPEADLLFDSNHSPSYEQGGQKIQTIVKGKEGLHLFSDDENSGSLRNDLFDYVEYHPPISGNEPVNGNNSVVDSSAARDDCTLLPSCAAISEVTLNSPIPPDYTDNSHSIKYRFKYSNRKKGEKMVKTQQEGWHEEVTSSQNVMQEEAPMAIQEETVVDTLEDVELSQGNKSDHCPIHGGIEASRNCKKIGRKTCLCLNGSRNVYNPRKRMNSPKGHSPVSNKKLAINKKR